MAAIGPPWSQLTAYDLNTGEIKWRCRTARRRPPAIARRTRARTCRAAGRSSPPAGSCSSPRRQTGSFRAYDRDNGKVLWSKELASGSEGMPASYEVNGRQFIALPVAAGDGLARRPRSRTRAPQQRALRRVRAAEEVASLAERELEAEAGAPRPRCAGPATANFQLESYFGGGGGESSAPSQCSSALPSTKRQVSNQVV